ncbi:MAG: DUF1972 domain-containing protein [Lachnospiraceae bacterium]|nr:DUF1972 domain-containing protein [Lachnospiraceae bacterium]
MRHIYVMGAKSIGMYGGFESFVMQLLRHHEDRTDIKYHVACKANGYGSMKEGEAGGGISRSRFFYCNSDCFLIKVPEHIGNAQAIIYDIKTLKWICEHIEKHHIRNPIVYILASRIGPFERKYVKRIHAAGGYVFQNPDGHENRRRKYTAPVRMYWKLSERYAVKYADMVICDNTHIEDYIKEEYRSYKPKTKYIAYGADINASVMGDDDPKYVKWLRKNGLEGRSFYVSVGRFVPENNFDIMIREFMNSHTDKPLVMIRTENPGYEARLRKELKFDKDPRIKLADSVYDQELLAKIRANAYGYLHGHEVGGTNPSLLEALGNTKLNLIYDVPYNREVALDAALYWNKKEGSLAGLIDRADRIAPSVLSELNEKAKKRIRDDYSWSYICDKYAALFSAGS